jgi:hypothetical protein
LKENSPQADGNYFRWKDGEGKRMKHSFLMIGQSNMAGRGRLADVPPIENDKLFMLRNGRWWPFSEPVNCDRPFTGISLAASFADSYQHFSGEETGLIPCADGGSSLEEWAVGGQLFSHAVYLTKLARQISEVKGILWHQGEAETELEENARTYVPRFLKILCALRKECGLEKVPVIIGELGAFIAQDAANPRPYVALVNQALKEIAAANPDIGLATSEGLGHNGDYLHFNAASCREYGLRYFGVYRQLVN